MATKRVIFIRPGETGWNRLERWQGHVAIPLNDHGQQQAERLARFVRPTGIRALFTSDLRRSMDTARILAKMLNIEPVPDERLRERHIGIWQGLTQDEVIAWYPAEYAALVANPDGYQIPGGEARAVVAVRMKASFDEIIAQTGDDTIGIVSHTTAIRALLGVLMPDIDALTMPFANMSVTSLAQDAGQPWRITQRNDVTHLEGMPTEVFKELEQKA